MGSDRRTSGIGEAQGQRQLIIKSHGEHVPSALRSGKLMVTMIDKVVDYVEFRSGFTQLVLPQIGDSP
jgi:hypothetical protein